MGVHFCQMLFLHHVVGAGGFFLLWPITIVVFNLDRLSNAADSQPASTQEDWQMPGECKQTLRQPDSDFACCLSSGSRSLLC